MSEILKPRQRENEGQKPDDARYIANAMGKAEEWVTAVLRRPVVGNRFMGQLQVGRGPLLEARRR